MLSHCQSPYSFTQQGIERYEFNKLTRFQSLIPMLHLTFQIAKRLTKTKVEPGYRSCLKHCMQRTMWKLQVFLSLFFNFSIFFVKSDLVRYQSNGLRVVYQPRESEQAPPNYCEVCEDELFCILFVKVKPDKDENGYVKYFLVLTFNFSFKITVKSGRSLNKEFCVYKMCIKFFIYPPNKLQNNRKIILGWICRSTRTASPVQ